MILTTDWNKGHSLENSANNKFAYCCSNNENFSEVSGTEACVHLNFSEVSRTEAHVHFFCRRTLLSSVRNWYKSIACCR